MDRTRYERDECRKKKKRKANIETWKETRGRNKWD